MSSESNGITRRAFNAALGAGAVGAAFHPVPAGQASRAPATTPALELCAMTAVELADRLRRKQVSAREVMTAHLAQMERVNPRVNAIVTLVADQAMANAARADDAMARRGPVGVLHGLPVAHKDLVDTAGIRTTRGSLFYKDHVPTMANPALAVPAGFTAAGLPVGLQIVGRHRDEWSVLQLGHAFEQATKYGTRRPAVSS
jgi:Asp-tRNA(Asn)/Glu-tRNA(Gln) amidotransferase A subunit family amidase